MDEKPMKAINIVDKKNTKIKAPDVRLKLMQSIVSVLRRGK